jgi:hypothetical protein
MVQCSHYSVRCNFEDNNLGKYILYLSVMIHFTDLQVEMTYFRINNPI